MQHNSAPESSAVLRASVGPIVRPSWLTPEGIRGPVAAGQRNANMAAANPHETRLRSSRIRERETTIKVPDVFMASWWSMKYLRHVCGWTLAANIRVKLGQDKGRPQIVACELMHPCI